MPLTDDQLTKIWVQRFDRVTGERIMHPPTFMLQSAAQAIASSLGDYDNWQEYGQRLINGETVCSTLFAYKV